MASTPPSPSRLRSWWSFERAVDQWASLGALAVGMAAFTLVVLF